MFQIGVANQKKAVPVLSALAAMGAAGMASHAMASTTITIDPYVPAIRDVNSPIIKYTDSNYWPTKLQGTFDWTAAQSVEANGSFRDNIGWFTWDYDFSALAGQTIESATLVLGPRSDSYGFAAGSHITVAALTSPVDLRTGLVGEFHDPYTNSVTAAFPNGGAPDGINAVAMPFDMTDIVKAWQANPSSFHGVETWSTDAAAGKAWIYSPAGQYGPTNGGKLVITYDSVPEPTIIAIGASVGGLALLRRRRS